MIITQLAGGLGNQLFEYAIGRRLAQLHGVELALDLSGLTVELGRTYRLGYFNIRERFATPEEVMRFTGRPARNLLERLWRQKRKLRPYYRRRVVIERPQLQLQFDPHFMQMPAEAYLVGCWQNERYFAPIAEAIRQEFTLKERLSAPSAAVERDIQGNESVGVHVRRGDYAAHPGINQRHGLCTVEYYQACAQEIVSHNPRAVFYVFSDDPQWAAENLHLGPARVIVDHNGPERDYEDFHLLSRCRHFIIANSSFSWWAAWLSPRPGKIVYAPRRWMADARYDTRDIIPARWRRV